MAFEIAEGFLRITTRSEADREIAAFQRRAQATLDRVEKDFSRSGDEAGKGWASSAVRSFGANIGGLISRAADKGRETGSAFTSAMGSVLATIGKVGMFAQLVGGLAMATNAVATFTTALVPAIGIVAALPGVLAGAAAAGITLKVALSGVGDAFSAGLSGDAAAFDEALKKLSPNAQQVARDFRDISPGLREIKTLTQDAFFKPLSGQIKEISANLMGPLREGMTTVGGSLGRAAAEVGNFAKQGQTATFVKDLFAQTGLAVDRLAPSIQPALAGFRDIASVGLTQLVPLSGGISDMATRFGTFLTNAANSGRAMDWINNAKEVFKQLGAVASDVGTIISSIFRAVMSQGGDAFGTLSGVLDKMAKFAESMQGQAALGSIFQTLAILGGQFGGVIVSIVSGLGQIAPIAGRIGLALGPALSTAIDAIARGLVAMGPGLEALAGGLGQAISGLAPAMQPLGTALGAIGSALAPLLPVIGSVAGTLVSALAPAVTALSQAVQNFMPFLTPLIEQLGGALGDALSTLAPVVGDLASSILGALGPALEVMVGAISEMLPMLEPAIEIMGGAFADTIKSMGPILEQIAVILSDIFIQALQALLPVFTELQPAIMQLVQDLLPQLLPLLQMGADLFSQLMPIIVQLVSIVIGILVPAVQILTPILSFLIGVLTQVAQAYMFVVQPIMSFISWLLQAITSVQMWKAVGDFFIAQWELIKGTFSAALSFLGGLWTAAWSAQQQFVQGVWNAIKGFIQGAMDGIRGVVSTGVSMVKGAIDGMSSIPGKVAEFFGRMVSSARDKAGELVGYMRGLPGDLISALGGLGERFFSAGKRIIEGLINGIKSMAGAAKDAAKGVADKIAGVLPGSPVRYGPLTVLNRGYAGGQIVRMLAGGITSSTGVAQSAATRLADSLAGPMTGAGFTVGTTTGAGGTTSSGSGGAVTYVFEPGSVVVDASTLRSVRDLEDLFTNIEGYARQFGGRGLQPQVGGV